MKSLILLAAILPFAVGITGPAVCKEEEAVGKECTAPDFGPVAVCKHVNEVLCVPDKSLCAQKLEGADCSRTDPGRTCRRALRCPEGGVCPLLCMKPQGPPHAPSH